MGSIIARLVIDESGQDLIEYALLSTVIGFAAVAGVGFLSDSIGTVYDAWNTSNNGLWETPNPAPVGE